MTTRTVARLFLSCALLLLAFGAKAQTEAASDEQPRNRIIGADRGELEKLQREAEQRRLQLQRRLADPSQRAQLRAERIEEVRDRHPDLGRVLSLDAGAEMRLLGLLADQQLALEMRPDQFGSFLSLDPRAPTSQGTLDYNQRMLEISRLLGAKGLDDFIDYQATLEQRRTVERLNVALPTTSRLGSAQKDQMVVLLAAAAEDSRRKLIRVQPFRFPKLGEPYVEPSERQTRLDTLAINEASVLRMQNEQRELMQRLARLLTPEQSKVFAAQLRQLVDNLLAGSQQVRRSLGLGPDEKLVTSELEPPAPALTSDVQLTLQVRFNDAQLTRTVVSLQGAPVSFDGPDGLSLQVHPFLITSDEMMVEVQVFEAVGSARRKICEFASGVRLTNPRAASGFGGESGSQCFGRKGYDMVFGGTATYR